MIIEAKIITNAKKNLVIKLEEINKYKIKVSTPPINGRANKKIIEILSKYFNTKKSNINIKKGERARNKIIEIEF